MKLYITAIYLCANGAVNKQCIETDGDFTKTKEFAEKFNRSEFPEITPLLIDYAITIWSRNKHERVKSNSGKTILIGTDYMVSNLDRLATNILTTCVKNEAEEICKIINSMEKGDSELPKTVNLIFWDVRDAIVIKDCPVVWASSDEFSVVCDSDLENKHNTLSFFLRGRTFNASSEKSALIVTIDASGIYCSVFFMFNRREFELNAGDFINECYVKFTKSQKKEMDELKATASMVAMQQERLYEMVHPEH
jgi:hypothetical protein